VPRDETTVEHLVNIWKDSDRLHTLRTTLFGLPLNKLFKLVEEAKVHHKRGELEFELMFSVVNSISKQRLFKPVQASGSDPVEQKFMRINFVNKGIEYLNISNILRNKKVIQNIL